MKLKKILSVFCLLCAMLPTGNCMANIWFKGEAAIRASLSNVEMHQFFIRWMRKTHNEEDAMVVNMTIPPNSPVYFKVHRGTPIELLFDMCDSKGTSIGELKFIVPAEMWDWDTGWVSGYLRRWDRNFYHDADWIRTKVVPAYFHAFFTPPKECDTLFLKTVRTCEEDIYYDLRNVGPKVVATGLKTGIDKRSIRCEIVMFELNQGADTERLFKRNTKGMSNDKSFRHGIETDNGEDLQGKAMLENTRTLRSQLNEMRLRQNELSSEISMLKDQNNQMKQQCERLEEEKVGLIKEKKGEHDALKVKTDLLDKTTLQLRNIERARSEATARVKGFETEIETLKQRNQSLEKQVDSFKSGRWKNFAFGMLAGLLVVAALLKVLK